MLKTYKTREGGMMKQNKWKQQGIQPLAMRYPEKDSMFTITNDINLSCFLKLFVRPERNFS